MPTTAAIFFRQIGCFAAVAALLPGLLSAADAGAKVNLDAASSMNGINIIEKSGDRLPLDLSFTDSDGKIVRLGDLMVGDMPVILTLNYYECPMLCTLELNGMVKSLKQLDFKPGAGYRLVTVSIDPKETPALAAGKGGHYRAELGVANAADWRFLVGDEAAVAALTKAVGFQYFYDHRRDEWAHAACIFVLTPDGRLSRYLYGIDFPQKDLRLSLLEASEGTIGTTFDRFLLFCFHYDPQGKKYALAATNLMRAGGAVTVFLLAVGLTAFWRRERANRLRNKPQPDATAA